MAFKPELIESFFGEKDSDWPLGYISINDFKKTTDYHAIHDFLVGKINTLPTLDRYARNFVWGRKLLPLLDDVENPTLNDQLILDLIYHPDMHSGMQDIFLDWLMIYVFNNPTENSFKEVRKRFLQYGLWDSELVSFLVDYLDKNNSKANYRLLDRAIFIKSYLIEHLLNQYDLFYPSRNGYSYGSSWYLEYLKLLEDVRPDFADDYAYSGAMQDPFVKIPFFKQYKNGEYLIGIQARLEIEDDTTRYVFVGQYIASLYLFKTDEIKYTDFILRQSKRYLNYYHSNYRIDQWENKFPINDFNNDALSEIPYSSCAFHIWFKYDNLNARFFLLNCIDKKIELQPKTVEVIYYHLSEEALPFFKLALKSDVGGIDYLSAVINSLAQHFNPSEYMDELWTLVGVKSKNLKSIVINTLAEKDPEAEPKAITLLNHKKADIRQTAASILSYFPSEKATEAILQVLNKEVNDNARDVLLQAVSESLPRTVSKDFVGQMITAAADRGKLSKPVESWLNEAELPALFYTGGEQLSAEAIRFLLYRMSRVKTMQSDTEAKYLLQLLDKEKAAAFAKTLIKLFIDKGAKPEHKYLLAIAALLGNDEVVDYIRRTTDRWIDESRYKMAEYGVGALAIQGSNKALRWVEWYSRKYKSKKANVGAAALVALETAGNELGITIHELGDRIVPDFGFEGLFKEFAIGAETYRAFIDSNFKIAFFNDDNKKLKALPASADAELKEEFKNIAKEVRDIVRSQSSRLEYYLVIQRRWTLNLWQSFFLQNPVMFIYATKLLWAVYDNEGNTTQTFVCNDDTTLLDINNDEIELPDDASIGIVHPSQLDEATLTAWRKQFFELSIDPIFPQLDRKLGGLADIDLSKAIITKFDGIKTENESIRNTLDKRGWHKGPTGDGGMLDSYNLLYFEKKMEAVLEIEGVGAGYGWGGEEALGRLYFVDKSKAANKWFNHPENDDDPQLIKLQDVSAIFLNETLAAVEAIKSKIKTV